ncbi:uncharacterized protein BYT42DRAFT_549505 [Radiomyces spectabilis]|uniref:uncharacterized protein n=1 Tax=Radiomyces spectabilis TaxID=64574 RepID=UPI002220B467|nr:uncharacterized protein BYT42DRAFT_549505 [Radiomyces spectabilis]KAI8367453.1 hypothetical protein BYT42DRAFT_549505 [Radiomyces spectabilis]
MVVVLCGIAIYFLSYWSLCVSAYRALSRPELESLSALSVPHRLDADGDLLAPLLVPRVSGTSGNVRVQQFIANHFEQLGWSVQLDQFTDSTPFGAKNFTNVIATKYPDAASRLVLAAHFDSKYYSDFEFIGATDSAVPCAILMDLAETMNPLLDSHKGNMSLQLIFFDGEEAFVSWSDGDSTYGARHLAQEWETQYSQQQMQNKGDTTLNKIEVLVLLDLLGTPNPQFPNYYRSTDWLFRQLVNLETRLGDASLLATSTNQGKPMEPMFVTDSFMTYQGQLMSDDHVPFLRRGVNILHIIPSPFPDVWHKQEDNAECIDAPTVNNLAIIFRSFVAEYLELQPK